MASGARSRAITLPHDVAIALSRAGISAALPDDELVAAIRSAIADRRGYLGEIEFTDFGYRVELLSPAAMTFDGRTVELALAWVLIYLMGETGELGVGGFTL